jgi:hypothetical protein
LEQLPSLVAELAREWSIRVGRVYTGGSEALVAEATLPDGAEAVLKVLMPSGDEAITNEITTLRLANGVGCARLFAADAGRRALLLERLGRPLGECGRPVPGSRDPGDRGRTGGPRPTVARRRGPRRAMVDGAIVRMERLGRPVPRPDMRSRVERRIAARR